MTTARNAGIILALAAAIAFVPGGGDVAAVVSRALSVVFAGVIAWAGWWAYRRFALNLDALGDRHRALLFGAIGAIVLALAGANRLSATTSGSLALVVVLAGAAAALVVVWRRHREYG